MLTLGEFLAVISVCIASFSLGYKLGRDRSPVETEIAASYFDRYERLFLLT